MDLTKRFYWDAHTFHHVLYVFFSISLVVGLLFSHPVVSISVIALSVNWLWEMDYVAKVKRFLKSKTAILFFGLFLVHLLGLCWTEDLVEGVKDVRIKLPLLALPIIYSSIVPFSKKEFDLVILFFYLAVLINSFISFAAYLGAFGQIQDIREISLFISHIRFSLMIALAILIALFYNVKRRKDGVLLPNLLLISTIWLFSFLIILKALSGVIALVLAVLVIGILKVNYINYGRLIQKVGFAIIGLVLSVVLLEVYNFYKKNDPDLSEVPLFSPYGGEYLYNRDNKMKENGYYVKYFITLEEFELAWSKRSDISLSDQRYGYHFEEIVHRFLTSKGYRKDRNGVEKLTDEEVKAIENGIANVRFMDGMGFNDRVYSVIWELDNYWNGLNAGGSSAGMRIEFFKTGIAILFDNLLTGVGTGDLKNSFDDQYEKMNSTLDPKFRLRAHNQYLTFAIQFGVLGGVYFILCMFFPFIENRTKALGMLFLSIWIISIVSMINEDTMETQIGVTFLTFFYFFIYSQIKKEDYMIISTPE